MQDRWPGIVPPEEGVAAFLRRLEFNENAIRPIVTAYLETLAYLEESAVSESHGHTPPIARESALPKRGGAQVGDLIQWESQGVLQFEQPRRVRSVSDDGRWIAVEGSETGLPMSEVIVEEKAAKAEAPRFPILSAPKDDRPEGSTQWIRNDVGPDTKAIIYVTGPMGPREIGKLIRILEAQKAVLEDN